ncbi:hypothetical protein [Janthinobacterium lividum]|uniref:hypothetical protein n=1 Tax=Janthinobacterium lividum TaxID=29581 RepID=UPI000893C956|nr:hypothetical protein [Janthinobacterium lividum]MCC7712951.1 hypothetical protein [Janthinobacterium lividum]OEZ55714.1 hypothetical protein JANLI_31080 [Janthinobacterium lividum]WQE31389.1 hypothetical protein U0004_13555 [Janthinobacterium lividum]STQ96918.1 Uncharacterised protein [Janthinobacterium lividum]
MRAGGCLPACRKGAQPMEHERLRHKPRSTAHTAARSGPDTPQLRVADGGTPMQQYRYARSPASLLRQPGPAASMGAQGSSAFRAIAAAMGEQHGVDTSTLRATHNSPFPATVEADATLQGNKIHFAPGKDSEPNIKHEVGHHIINVLRGTPPRTDGRVNGQAVNTSDEAGADRLMRQPLQRRAAPPQPLAASGQEHDNGPVQCTIGSANRYISDNELWRNGRNDVFSLLAELYWEGSDEYDEIYRELMQDLPEFPGPATDGWDPVTSVDAEMFLAEEIEKLGAMYGDMPDGVRDRVIEWNGKVSRQGLARRKEKSSDAARKRSKVMNAAGDSLKLYHAKTAPTKNKQPPGGQGKSVFFNQNQFDYFRSSAANVQRDILGLTGDTKRGDAAFVNQLSQIYKPASSTLANEEEEQTALLKADVEPDEGSPLGIIGYRNPGGQGHPGPKLGAEVNSFTYNLLLKNSTTRTYAPAKKIGVPKQYLNSKKYRTEARKLVHHDFDTPEDYEAELFRHYRQIVSGAKRIYGDNECMFDSYALKLVYAGMAGETSFFTYPALIFEIQDKNNLGIDVPKIKQGILDKWNAVSDVTMTERQSFGFLYPAISDLEKSIRIWPGQYDIEGFLATLQKVISPHADVARSRRRRGGRLSLLQNTLKRSMNLAKGAVNRVAVGNDKVKVLLNRIASNYGKGLQILQQWRSWRTDVLFAEATQVIENLNEAALHLSTEYEQSEARGKMEAAVLRHYTGPVQGTGYTIASFYLTHSGQQGSSSAMMFHGADAAFVKKKVKDRGPVYFETMTSTAGPKSLSLVDPAYNFTTREELADFGKQNTGDAQIYDMTNMDPAALPGLLGKNTHAKVTLYASLSKHFQFGTDSTNLGFVMHLQKAGDEAPVGSYLPKGAVWDMGATRVSKKPAYVPAVPSALYHHASLLLDAQTGTSKVAGKRKRKEDS